ncbi:serine/threonine-protein kinase [Actinoplanes sp. NPDC026619]|uniref:serine/threonine-protein kinase n=1 Tax=Actinoplanes sp. NPDC026619 TaxID=3155798 RepID=UPI0033FF9D2C
MSDDWPGAGTLLATRYRLVTLLETGGMAQVWRATDELLGRPVAIKLATGPHVAWREARMAAKLSHPNIAAVHDYREAVRADGSVAPFVVMELLAGETIAARLERETFSWQEAARVGAAVADALAAAHSGGVVHRDIKPGNVMLTPTGVKILDFGISTAAGEPDDDDTGATFGTPAYVAPERLDGMPAEPATDVYGLGILLFEMVTGDPPYPVDTWEELDEARQKGPSTLPESLPADFRTVVDHCLEELPADRPGADEVRFTLTALWLADQPADAPAVEPPIVEVSAVELGAERPALEPVPAGAGARPAAENLHPRVAQIWSGTTPRPGYAPGRAAPATVPMSDIEHFEPPKRRIGLVLGVLAILLAAIGAYMLVNRPKNRTDANPPPQTHPATLYYSRAPTVPSVAPSSPAPTVTSAPPRLAFADAVSRLRTTVEDGAATGEIRGDVATDLLNLIRNLERATKKDRPDRIEQIRLKVADRAGEGKASLSAGRATILRARLTDVSRSV